MSPRLPTPGSDDGQWGIILNDFLSVEHNTNGTLKSSGSIAGKYTKPTSGIPETDLSSSVQDKLNTAGSGGVADGTITTAKLQDGAVTNVKVASGAAIAQSKIANLTTDLAGKAATSHTHTIANTTGLQTALDAKAAAVSSMAVIREVNGAYQARPSVSAVPNVLWIGESDATANGSFVQWNPVTGAGDLWAEVPLGG